MGEPGGGDVKDSSGNSLCKVEMKVIIIIIILTVLLFSLPLLSTEHNDAAKFVRPVRVNLARRSLSRNDACCACWLKQPRNYFREMRRPS